MKFLFLDTYYPSFLKDYYRRNYRESIFKSLFGTSNFYSNALTRLGHPSKTVVLNDHQGQLDWAKRHGFSVGSSLDPLAEALPFIRGKIRPKWVVDTLIRQIEYYKPDALYFLDITYLDPSIVFELKSRVRFIIGQIASPLPCDQYFKPFDLITSSLPNIVAHIRQRGTDAVHLKLAFEPRILTRLHKSGAAYPVIHIGGYGPIHQERNKVLNTAAKKIHIDFFGYHQDNLPADSPIRTNFHGQSWGKEMYSLLYNSKITMTKHITSVAGPYANNMTLFEATGCGTLLLTDNKKNLDEMFIPGKEVVTYDNGTELSEKINYYLNHETQRQKIAFAGQQRTLLEHNYDRRMQELLELLGAHL